MGFNEQSFRKAAKEAGYGDSEIDSAVAEQKQSINTATGKPFGEQGDAEMKAAKEKVEAAGGVVAVPSQKAQAKAKEQSFGDKFLNFVDPTQNPLAGPIEAVLAYKAAEMAANKAKEFVGGLKDRSINKSPMAKGGDVVDVQAKEVAPIPKGWEDIIAKSEQNAAAKAAAKANPVPQNYTAGVPSGQPNAPVNPAGAFTQPSGYGQTTSNVPNQVNQPPTITSPVIPTAEVGPVSPTTSVQAGVENGSPAKAVQSVIAKEIDKSSGMYRDAQGNMVYPEKMSPAARTGYEAFTKQYPDLAKTLEAKGQFGILGAGSGDNNLFNSYESDMMKRLRNEVNQGQMVGPYTNYETKVNPAIRAIPPESTLGKDLAELRANQVGGKYGELGTPASIGGKKGGLITGPNTVPKALKAGGPAMLLMAMADAAKAAQQGNFGEAAVRGADVATDYLPMISQLKQGLAPTEAGAPGVSKQTIENAYKLGSPYAQTEEAKKARLREKAGAGRGIAPPSAYMR